MLIGYARVSTGDQNLDLQKNALVRAECEQIFEDTASGKNSRRPGLRRAIRRLKPGDSLVVWKLDRLGRSVRDLITLVSELQARGVNFRSLTDSIDTSTPAGRFFFHVMSALAEMERELIVERTRAGLAAAREQGRVGGRRRVMTEEVVERCRRMLENGATRQQIADVIGVGVKTIYKYFPAAVRDQGFLPFP
ncbi:TPA: recombinase family protein [Klebsiella pneumoniae]|nr:MULTISPECIES: recombinase family protein [Klebsiella]APM69892.1 DNA-invertase [Klebsiella pneumoniae]APM75516.1 DNA-invertase [Klebsiella pneumoniae]APQ25751.1 DNA-invertase hin [Klebsiella pneumoniae]ATN98489.1 DNA-invertase [Klebsiella pneumoniae subsp. pneumoniae]ATO05086.1 DNA-invertase [Klebsiella pneumoniae subsp. pneumoniae]